MTAAGANSGTETRPGKKRKRQGVKFRRAERTGKNEREMECRSRSAYMQMGDSITMSESRSMVPGGTVMRWLLPLLFTVSMNCSN